MTAPSPSAYAYPLLIRQLLHTPLACAPDQEIVYRDQVRLTYRQFAERLGRLASGLASLGVGPGDTVAVMDWDSHRYLECFFAVPMMGAVLHTVNVRLSPEQILYTINHAEDDVILVHHEFLPILEQIRDRIQGVKRFVLLADGAPAPATSVPLAAEYEQLLAASAPEYPFADFDEHTRATTFYTTGTTGLPKGVHFSHRQLVLHTLAGLGALSAAPTQGRFHRGDVYMPITPMFHVHAWGIPYMATAMGVKQVYPGRYVPDALLGLIGAEGVTFSHCVPTILHMLLASPASQTTDLSRWKVVIGGAALPKPLCRAALARGIDLYTGYGMSETCPILTLAQLTAAELAAGDDQQLEARCKTGRPIPLVDLRIVDEEMADQPRDGKATGEIVVRSPWLTQGYLKDPKSSDQLWRGGYLHTGDVANIDAAGRVQICDRIKDVIKTGGEWVSSLDVEDLIAHHPGVSEVAVIGAPDPRWGERPMALVVAKAAADAAVTADEVRALVQGYADRGVVSRYAVPDRVVFVAAIDKTSVGKIDKKVLRQKYL
ncbi:MAG: fatty acid--CoA ligase [Deferrisomatales bacterium]